MTWTERFISTCPTCNDSVTKDGHAPRERMCKCGTWVPYVEVERTECVESTAGVENTLTTHVVSLKIGGK